MLWSFMALVCLIAVVGGALMILLIRSAWMIGESSERILERAIGKVRNP